MLLVKPLLSFYVRKTISLLKNLKTHNGHKRIIYGQQIKDITFSLFTSYLIINALQSTKHNYPPSHQSIHHYLKQVEEYKNEY